MTPAERAAAYAADPIRQIDEDIDVATRQLSALLARVEELREHILDLERERRIAAWRSP